MAIRHVRSIVIEKHKMIDYDHVQDGLTCSGVLSNIDGPFEAYWTLDQQGHLATEERDLTDGAFGLLWDGIASLVSTGGCSGSVWLLTRPAWLTLTVTTLSPSCRCGMATRTTVR